MRIDLSKKWQQSRSLLLSLIAVISVGTAVFCIWSNSQEDYIMCLCAAWFILVAACLLFFSRRLCTYAVIEEDHIQSFLPTSQILCTISTTDAVYYAIFTSPEGSAHGKEFIAISNSPFEYQETYGIAKVRFLQHYDMAKQIVLPYDNQTIKLLDIQKWHKVN